MLNLKGKAKTTSSVNMLGHLFRDVMVYAPGDIEGHRGTVHHFKLE
jgi:hypothetical protein